MNMTSMDWLILLAFACALIGVSVYTSRYNRSVADFLAANRCAGRYLLVIALGAAQFGAASLVLQMQESYITGLASKWYYALLSGPLMAVIVATGWIVYRFRETRALTLAQFFEMRYSRRFRIFAGLTAFLAGIINYGLFPAIGAEFFINYCGLPEHIGPLSTFQLAMFVLLGLSLYFTFSGGQVTVIVTDFLQGMFTNLVLVAILVVILFKFGIGTILDGLELAPPGQSMLNPMDIKANKGFNLFYYILVAIMGLYGYKTWQSEQGYNCAARTPHEAKMSGILSVYRYWAFLGAMTLIPLAAYAFMHHPDYADQTAPVHAALEQIDNEEIRLQMTVPVVMSQFIPHGLLGLFAAAVFAAFISTHNTQLHSWGSIFIQDVVMPFRNKPLAPKMHMWCLKCSVFGVAIFVFVFSSLFKQTQHFQIYAMVTGILYVGGAGIAIIGGLYWKRATAEAAWAAMIIGAVIAMTALGLEQIWTRLYDESFPISFKTWTAIAMGSSITAYVFVSLLSRQTFDMDKMLHRGRYRVDADHEEVKSTRKIKQHAQWLVALGWTDEFTKTDKWLWGIGLGQALFFFVYTVIFTVGSFIFDYDVKTWRYIQSIRLWQVVVLFAPVAIWLTIGGFRDLFQFYAHLRTAKRDARDDGSVSVPSDPAHEPLD